LYKRNPVPTKKESASQDGDEARVNFIRLGFWLFVGAEDLFEIYLLYNFPKDLSLWPFIIFVVCTLAVESLVESFGRQLNYKVATIVFIAFLVVTRHDALLYYVKKLF
jgi:hypothetical protein